MPLVSLNRGRSTKVESEWMTFPEETGTNGWSIVIQSSLLNTVLEFPSHRLQFSQQKHCPEFFEDFHNHALGTIWILDHCGLEISGAG